MRKKIILSIVFFATILFILASCFTDEQTPVDGMQTTPETNPAESVSPIQEHPYFPALNNVIQEHVSSTYSPDDKYVIEGHDADIESAVSGIIPVREIRIVEIDSGLTVWKMEGLFALYQEPQFCWSPDSRYVSVAYAGRTWVNALIVDTADMSQRPLPYLTELAPLFPDAVPKDDRADPCIVPQLWQNETTIEVYFHWYVKDGYSGDESGRFFGSYLYDVETGALEIVTEIIDINIDFENVYSNAGCADSPAEKQDDKAMEGMLINFAPLEAYSFDELLEAKATALEREHDDIHDLSNLIFIYTSNYAETWCILSIIEISRQIAVVKYNLSEPEQSESGFFDFTLQLYRESETVAEQMLSGRIEQHELQPWTVDGVFYKDVDNDYPMLKNFMQFYWVHDGNLFFMQLTTELVNRINENDPEAMHGRLFELQRVDLNS